MTRDLLFSLTKKDFEIQTFKSGGKGGQHQNTTDSGVRIIHKDSGAVGECRNEKSQHANKKIAFKRLTENIKFKTWLNIKAHEVIKGITIEQNVENMLTRDKLKIEGKDENDNWVELKD